MWCWRRIEKLKWSDKVTNEQVLERIGDKRTLLNNILCRKANWIGHSLITYCVLHDAIEGQMTEVKGVGGRKRTQLLDDLRSRKNYWELKEEAENRKRWINTKKYHVFAPMGRFQLESIYLYFNSWDDDGK